METITIVLVLTLVASMISLFFASSKKTKQKLASSLASAYGQPPAQKECELESIGMYSAYQKANAPDALRIDDITWNDLDMDKVFGRINVCQTSVGEEYLYHCLHKPCFDISSLLEREKAIGFFAGHAQERLAAQVCLAGLGKLDYNRLSSFIFNTDIKTFKYPVLFSALTLLPLLCSLMLFFNLYTGVACILAAFVINLIVYFTTKIKINIEIPAIGYFASMLHCCGRLSEVKGMEALPLMADMQKHYAIFKPLRGKLPELRVKSANDLDVIVDYVNILLLRDIRRYNRFIKRILQFQDDFHALYRAVGEMDLALCVASFRESLPAFSVPEFHGPNTIAFDAVYHPLIPCPVTNDGIFAADSLITGSNASGKSTFIKALAVNGILAQTIYTCAAKRFLTRLSLVVTSMAMRDNLSGGDSYFIVEVKSLKRIMDFVRQYPCVCYVDEILRGTNTIERIAASTSVLEYLHKQDCLCVVASHDIELTNILAGKYDNYHFSEQITDSGIVFDYKLKPGASTTRNAIKLLSFMAFDAEIVSRAEALAGDEANHSNGFRAKP